MNRSPVAEIGVSALIILICAVFWIEAAKLPPGSFEPLGSGPVPKYTAGIIIFCCLIVITRAILRIRSGPGLASDIRAEFRGRSPAGALIIAAGTLIYALLLHYKVLPFGIVTCLFLFVMIWTLEDMRTKAVIPAAITAVIASFGVEYLFTNLFVVDLPA